MGHLLICAATKREIRTWFPEIPDSLKMGDVHLIKFKKKKNSIFRYVVLDQLTQPYS